MVEILPTVYYESWAWADEFKKITNLQIVSKTAGVLNPFHGRLQSAKRTIVIYLERPPNITSLRLTLWESSVSHDDGITQILAMTVLSIAVNSPFKKTILRCLFGQCPHKFRQEGWQW